mmetsp:Transcript_27183/g.37454  ORF Transcript_27183/g.37454 Transcript_27183/m.37454 type:complete len:131 (-) Transcript_27183:1765-2157(-)
MAIATTTAITTAALTKAAAEGEAMEEATGMTIEVAAGIALETDIRDILVERRCKGERNVYQDWQEDNEDEKKKKTICYPYSCPLRISSLCSAVLSCPFLFCPFAFVLLPSFLLFNISCRVCRVAFAALPF